MICILRELQGISVKGFRLFLLHFSSRDRILAERTETSAMPRGLWGEVELVGNPAVTPARAFIRTKVSFMDVGMEVTS